MRWNQRGIAVVIFHLGHALLLGGGVEKMEGPEEQIGNEKKLQSTFFT